MSNTEYVCSNVVFYWNLIIGMFSLKQRVYFMYMYIFDRWGDKIYEFTLFANFYIISRFLSQVLSFLYLLTNQDNINYSPQSISECDNWIFQYRYIDILFIYW